MILTNVGLQIYNNWCGSRQNDKLQQKREEFERAAKERNTEHMWKLLREGQELTMQLEKEKHDDRLKELQGDLDNLLKEITHEQTIINWPLKVLPIVMKNQAFGNLLANQEENVAMHVLFAKSNYGEFNKLVHPIIEKALELHSNQHWSTKSDHPILFYSGAWDTQKCPMNPNDIQITALQTQLSNLPTLLITPFFRPKDGKLVFQVNMWGVGASKNDTFSVKEIEPMSDEFHFQRIYTNQQDYENEVGLLDEIVEDLVPYLECMIGYMADTYFWSSSGLAPHLPLLVTNGTINTDGMKYLISDSREYYDNLLNESINQLKNQPFIDNRLLTLYCGTSYLMNVQDPDNSFETVLLMYCSKEACKLFENIEDAFKDNFWRKNDVDYISGFVNFAPVQLKNRLISFIDNKNKYFLRNLSLNEFDKSLYVEEFIEEFDLLEIVTRFEKYCETHKNEIDYANIALFIENVEYEQIRVHLYNPESGYVIRLEEGFDFLYTFNHLKRIKNIKKIFNNKNHNMIYCRIGKIDKLKKQLTTLIY